jgi:hypothetical protein
MTRVKNLSVIIYLFLLVLALTVLVTQDYEIQHIDKLEAAEALNSKTSFKTTEKSI